jgi:hypothetical protein
VPPVDLQVLIIFSSYHCSAVTHTVPCRHGGIALSGATHAVHEDLTVLVCMPYYATLPREMQPVLVVFASFRAQKVAGAVTVALLVFACVLVVSAGVLVVAAQHRFAGAGSVQANCIAV